MRTLKFKVTNQHIQKDPDCSFYGLVSGSKGYLRAEFSFTPDWDGCVKAASFWVGDVEHAVVLINDACMIPEEAVADTKFFVGITGKRAGMLVTTDRAMVMQRARWA